ncbi:MAG: alkane 1-monooxygenase [Candidatus Cyclobacteriaceae bacterium M2_1C_046]
MTLKNKLGYLLSFTLPLWVIGGYLLGGWWNFITLFDVFILMPLLDVFFGTDHSNLSKEESDRRADEFFYRFVTYAWVYVQLALVIWGAYVVVYGNINTWYEWTGFLLSMAMVTGGIGITVAHELGHKKNKLEQVYSQILLMTVSYMHFYVEHNRGHHVYVATPEDPATARKNEDFYSFWIRSVFGGYKHAWTLENQRLKRKGKSPVSVSNKMIWFTLLPILFCAMFTIIFSINKAGVAWEVPLFFIGQSFFAFTLLELVNYVEHYGIMRKEIAPGQYERVTPIHSWNTDFIISNFFLFQLQRHSDHHYNAIKRYQVLNSYKESPQLPAGYPTMIMLAMFPPLWFKIMNPRVEKHFPQPQVIAV